MQLGSNFMGSVFCPCWWTGGRSQYWEVNFFDNSGNFDKKGKLFVDNSGNFYKNGNSLSMDRNFDKSGRQISDPCTAC